MASPRAGKPVPGTAPDVAGAVIDAYGDATREDWRGWERIEAYLPQSERQDLIAELRGLTQGLGAFEADFDHMAELTGRLATEAIPNLPDVDQEKARELMREATEKWRAHGFDLNFDEQIGSPDADVSRSMAVAHQVLESFAPGH